MIEERPLSAAPCALEVCTDCLADVAESGFDTLALGHAAGQLGDVSDVTVVLRVEDEVD